MDYAGFKKGPTLVGDRPLAGTTDRRPAHEPVLLECDAPRALRVLRVDARHAVMADEILQRVTEDGRAGVGVPRAVRVARRARGVHTGLRGEVVGVEIGWISWVIHATIRSLVSSSPQIGTLFIRRHDYQVKR